MIKLIAPNCFTATFSLLFTDALPTWFKFCNLVSSIIVCQMNQHTNTCCWMRLFHLHGVFLVMWLLKEKVYLARSHDLMMVDFGWAYLKKCCACVFCCELFFFYLLPSFRCNCVLMFLEILTLLWKKIKKEHECRQRWMKESLSGKIGLKQRRKL